SLMYIWADWNKDGDFDDPGEEAYAYPSSSGFSITHTATFTVPVTATPRMIIIRVRSDWYNAVPLGYNPMTPCGYTSWGEVEDYGINVIVPCAAPTGFTLSGTTITTGSVTWTEPSELPDVGYNLYVTTTS